MNTLTLALLKTARYYLGTHESGGRNRGPQVDAWNAKQGAPMGSPWCVTSQLGILDETAGALALLHPYPRTGSVHGLWLWICKHYPHAVLSEPAPGCWVFHDAGKGQGHMGLVEAVNGVVNTLEGNTNVDGSREGMWFMEKQRHRDYWSLGCVDPSVPIAACFEEVPPTKEIGS